MSGREFEAGKDGDKATKLLPKPAVRERPARWRWPTADPSTERNFTTGDRQVARTSREKGIARPCKEWWAKI